MTAPLDDLMMDYPLTLTQFFERSRRLFASKTLATRRPGQPLFRYTYADFAERTQRLAGVLRDLGVRKGDRVATLAWNSHRHLELYWAIPLSGAVLHTLNFRLSAQDLTYIINHAGDSVIFVDASVWPCWPPSATALTTVRTIVVMRDGPPSAGGHPGAAAAVPADLPEYETLITAATPLAAWPQLDETDAAGMCYTSGTTGHPKGVVYTHRALYLHCLAQAMVDSLALSESDVILHVVPMFHANAWCVPFTGDDGGLDPDLRRPQPAAARHLRDHPGREGHVRGRGAHRVDRGEGAGGARGLRHLVHPRPFPSAARRPRAACSSTSTRRSAPRWCTPGA